jgi:transposase
MARKGRRSTPEEKIVAVRMMQSGTSPDDVARIFEVSRAIAYRWNQLYEKHGASALEIKKAPRPNSVTDNRAARRDFCSYNRQ